MCSGSSKAFCFLNFKSFIQILAIIWVLFLSFETGLHFETKTFSLKTYTFCWGSIQIKQVRHFEKVLHKQCCTRSNQNFISFVSYHWQLSTANVQGKAEQECSEAVLNSAPAARSPGNWVCIWHLPAFCSDVPFIPLKILKPPVPCHKEFPGSATSLAKTHAPASWHVVEKALSSCSSPCVPQLPGLCRTPSPPLVSSSPR